jgi:hypothetical protein
MPHWIRSRKLIAALVAIALLSGLYALLGFWALPKLAGSLASDYVRNTLQHELTIGQLRFNPFTFELDVEALELRKPAAAGEGEIVLALLHGHVDFELSSLWRGAYVFNRVSLQEPYVHALLRADGTLNLADLVPPDDAQSSPSSAMPALEIAEFSLRQGRVAFADQRSAARPETQLAPIDFTLRDFRTTAESGGFQLRAGSAAGERFEMNGKLNLQPLSLQGNFNVAALNLQQLSGYVAGQLPVQLASGTLALGGDYAFSTANDATVLELQLPRISLDGLALRARGEPQDWVRLAQATLENTRLSLGERKLAIESLRVHGLSADLWLQRDGRQYRQYRSGRRKCRARCGEPTAGQRGDAAAMAACCWQTGAATGRAVIRGPSTGAGGEISRHTNRPGNRCDQSGSGQAAAGTTAGTDQPENPAGGQWHGDSGHGQGRLSGAAVRTAVESTAGLSAGLPESAAEVRQHRWKRTRAGCQCHATGDAFRW